MLENRLDCPTVSVVMPVYRRPYTLRRSVESILNQTFKDFELIIVLDGSDPQLEAILGELKDARLKVLVSPINQGIPKALNLGLKNCHGTYFARMDNGDWADPNRLQDQFDAVKKAGTSVSFCQASIEEPDGSVIERTTHQPWILRIWTSMFCQSLGTAGSALFVEAELLRSLGGFDEAFPVAQDYDLCERLAALGKEFAYTDRVGLVIPMYEDGISKQKRESQEERSRVIMARATRKILPSITESELRGLSVWRNRYRLPNEVDPMPGIRVLKHLGRAFARKHNLTRLPFSICNDIAQTTEIHLKGLPFKDRWVALRVILWCAAESRSLRLYKYFLGCLKRLSRLEKLA